MPMTRCDKNLHYFDPDKHSSCPYCRIVPIDIGETQAASQGGGGGGGGGISDTKPVKDTREPDRGGETRGHASSASGDTVGVYRRREGYDPVVGWLVCTDGEARGKDFRLRDGGNTVGRDGGNDVQITGDNTISGHAHATIVYDSSTGSFHLLPKTEAKNPSRLNGKMILMPTELKARDRIQLGQTVLVFVPLCNEEFRWPDSAAPGR
jgi:hypothetical protein